MGASASAASWRNPGGTEGRIRGKGGEDAPLDSVVGARAEDFGGTGPGRLCAWTDLDRGTYLELMSLKGSVCPSVKWVQNKIYLFIQNFLGTLICQTLVQALEHELEQVRQSPRS